METPTAPNHDSGSVFALRSGASLVRVFAWCLACTGLVSIAMRWYRHADTGWVNVVTIGLAMGLLVLVRKDRVRLAGTLLVLSLLPLLVMAAVSGGAGPYASSWIGMPILAVVAGWLMGGRFAVFIGALSIASLWAVYGWFLSGPPFAPQQPLQYMVNCTVATLVGIGIGFATSRSFAAQLHEVSTLSQGLHTANQELEQRVTARTAELSCALEDLKRTQASLVEHEKLASLGAMVAGISHELNTPLGNLLLTNSSLRHQVDNFARQVATASLRRTELDHFVATVQQACVLNDDAANKAIALVENFKQVARDKISEERRRFDLREVVQSHLAAIEPQLRKHQVAAHNHIPPGLACDSYPGPLGHLVTNIVLNAAIHGYPNAVGGTVALHAHAQAEHIALQFVDQGVGMDASTVARVFDPFFTTRLGQGGSGLGLSISKRIASHVLGGELVVQSAPGHGCTFTLTFPTTAPGAHASSTAAFQ